LQEAFYRKGGRGGVEGEEEEEEEEKEKEEREREREIAIKIPVFFCCYVLITIVPFPKHGPLFGKSHSVTVR
jgi:hypothetical protein